MKITSPVLNVILIFGLWVASTVSVVRGWKQADLEKKWDAERFELREQIHGYQKHMAKYFTIICPTDNIIDLDDLLKKAAPGFLIRLPSGYLVMGTNETDALYSRPGRP